VIAFKDRGLAALSAKIRLAAVTSFLLVLSDLALDGTAMIRKLILRILLVLAAAPASSAGSNDGTAVRPKIGLALAGGGARGLAHIGVLQWLEEHRIPVDYIAGTSMGALVGAYFATGNTPAQIRKVIREMDWDDILRGLPSYRNLSFRRKEDRSAFPNALELGLRKGIKLPAGLNSGHKIGLILDRLAIPYYDIKTFDELPIPFRCVATDLLKPKSEVFKEGSLSEALRATMAIPGIFAPIEINGVWYADGGIINNLPVDVVKEMGADIVMAVLPGRPPVSAETINSLLGIVDRSADIMILENEARNLRIADVALLIDLGKFTGSDYRAGEAIADLGYKAVEMQAPLLKGLALDEVAWQQYIHQRNARIKTGNPWPDQVEVDGTRGEATNVIAHRFASSIGKPLNERAVETELSRITGWGRYDSLSYSVLRNGDRNELKIKVREKQHGPPFINVGFEINGSEADDIRFTINGRLTMLDIAGYRSELRTDIGVGSSTQFCTEFYKPLGNQGWFLAPRAYHKSLQSNLYEHQSRLAHYRINTTGAGLDLGFGFGRFGEVRAGYDIGHVNAEVRVGNPLLPALEGRQGVASLRWTYDARDRVPVPHSGMEIRSAMEWVTASPGAAHSFPKLQMEVRFFQPVLKKSSLFLVASGGTSLGREIPIADEFTLGGPLRLGALGLDEIRTNQYVFSAAGFLREIFPLPTLLGGKISAAAWYETGKAWEAPDYPGLNHVGSAGLVIDTALGPLFLGGSIGEGGRHKFLFLLGRLF
jgi:NTE family protein